jgi:RNA polymerase sigma-70 factor (ECF subfamily)
VNHAQSVVDRLFRRESGRAIATLARATRDLDRAEEAVQGAFAVALERWPVDGIPDDPAAWIYVTARNRAVDAARREGRNAGSDALEGLPAPATGRDADIPAGEAWPDDRLALIFACCHPALAPEVRVALTLRHVAGLETAQVARSFLVSEAAMAQRLTRARRKLRDGGIPIAVPDRGVMPERLDSVLTTLYLVFTAGYGTATSPLCAEAIRLARLLAVLAPDEPEARGLLALLVLQESRRAARFDATGEVVLLADQDRSRWNRASIAEGLRLLDGAGRGRYALQARIAAEHARGETDWPAVAALYAELERLDPSPVVRLNGAVAIAESQGPDAGLAAVDAAGRLGALDGYHLFHSARAELLRRLGRSAEARESYDRALALATDPADQTFLRGKIGGLTPWGG